MSFQTGAGATMSRLGMADLGVATMNDMRDHASMIASIDPTVPLVADADTGYGGKSSLLQSCGIRLRESQVLSW